MTPNNSPAPPAIEPSKVQFSVQSLMILTGIVACGLAAWKLSGPKLFLQYFILLFCVGPWFAYLAAECLPIRARVIRTAVGNSILMILFFVALKIGERYFGWQALAFVSIAALLLWSPQYVAFFWRRAAGI